ncbi:hypothetical protein CCHR01_08014 [Colletotrichum chrysophilum]|uniref:Uncharacterized protein n=1 Tax=Colletotrichum chrysophilum TaxID=1836956 RepID=A0AAD9AM42_9PEZI|nr:hypothetical protein CCHR01_08014 [Colletotrichum chrysophilum]
MLNAITSLPRRNPENVIKSPAWNGAMTRGSGAVLFMGRRKGGWSTGKADQFRS